MMNALPRARVLRRTLALAVALMALVAVDRPAASSASVGVDRTICNADTVYIYKYDRVVESERLKALPRGAHFHVYYNASSAWAFGVHEASGVSGYVLREKLC